MDAESPAKGVLDALFDLHRLFQDLREKRDGSIGPIGNGIELPELQPVLMKLGEGVFDAEDLLRNPSPGQGIASLFVRLVATRLNRLNQWVNVQRNSWAAVLTHDHDDLYWLGLQAPQIATEVIHWIEDHGPSISKLLQPTRHAFDRLDDKANEWATEFSDAPDEPQGSSIRQDRSDAWQPWGAKHQAYVKACGRLLLEAIDQCEVTRDRMGNVEFAEATLASLADGGQMLLGTLCGRSFGAAEVARLSAHLANTAASPPNELDTPTLLGEWFHLYQCLCKAYHEDTVTQSWLESRFQQLHRFRALCNELGSRGEMLGIDASALFRFQGTVQLLDDNGRMVGASAELLDGAHTVAKRIDARGRAEVESNSPWLDGTSQDELPGDKREATDSKVATTDNGTTDREAETPFEVNVDISQIRIDGTSHDVPPESARMAKLLLDYDGEWVAMLKHDFTKPSETKKALPPKVLALIETSKGKGYRLKPRR